MMSSSATTREDTQSAVATTNDPNVARYRENREKWTMSSLQPHFGQWVAFSDDGSRLIASHFDLAELERTLAKLGENPESVVFECLREEDSCVGGAALS